MEEKVLNTIISEDGSNLLNTIVNKCSDLQAENDYLWSANRALIPMAIVGTVATGYCVYKFITRKPKDVK